MRLRIADCGLRIAALMIAAIMLACAGGASSSRTAVDGEAAPGKPGNEDKPKATTAFDGQRAVNHVKAQVEFGPHPAGSAEIEKAREYIGRELKSYGLKTAFDEFTEDTPRGKVKFKNVIAELPG